MNCCNYTDANKQTLPFIKLSVLMTVIVLHKFFKFRLKVSESFTHQQAIVFDDTQLFGPLAQPLLPPQEGTNPSVLHQFNGRLR